MRKLITALFAMSLLLATGTTASADPVAPTSVFGGTFFAMSADGRMIGFTMPGGRVRWEVDGLPVSLYGVDDVARAASVGYDSPSVLVFGGAIRGVYVASSADGSGIGYLMPDGSIRWEINGAPVG